MSLAQKASVLALHLEHLPKAALVSRGGLVSAGKTMDSEDRHHKSTEYDSWVHELWHGLLSQYTARQLTKSYDRLVALSGVAQQAKKSFVKDHFYMAGLWSSRLAAEMLWQVADQTTRERRKSARRHPSFSWFSVQGRVKNSFHKYFDSQFSKSLVTQRQ